jgi:hypothetical protein
MILLLIAAVWIATLLGIAALCAAAAYGDRGFPPEHARPRAARARGRTSARGSLRSRPHIRHTHV